MQILNCNTYLRLYLNFLKTNSHISLCIRGSYVNCNYISLFNCENSFLLVLMFTYENLYITFFKLYVICGIDMQSSSMFIQNCVLEPMGFN